jgi:hypothetical protein
MDDPFGEVLFVSASECWDKNPLILANTLTRTSRKSKTFKHEGHNGAQRKILKAFTSYYFVPFVFNFLGFARSASCGQGARIQL